MLKAGLLEKEPSTDSNTPDNSPCKDRCLSPTPEKSSRKTSRERRHAEKRKLVVSTIKNKLMISNIKTYVIKRSPTSDEVTTFEDIYKIKGLLGVGGFGVVLAVNNRQTNQDCALKICMKSEHARIINDEGDVLSLLDHPNIVEFRNFYQTRSRLLMEMELCRGGSLKSMMAKRNGQFSEDKVLAIMRKLLSAVSYIHSKDYIHRDIKPENILFGAKNDLDSVKLIDFGLSTIFPGMFTHDLKDKIGTILFMAPEQTDYSSYGKKIDIWACGMIMYQLLTGKHPFHTRGDTEASYLKKLNKRQNLVLPDDCQVSDMCRDFHSRLCKYLPTERYDAKTALLHPWMIGDHSAEMPLTPLEELKLINTEYKLKNTMKELFSLAVLKDKLAKVKSMEIN